MLPLLLGYAAVSLQNLSALIVLCLLLEHNLKCLPHQNIL